MEYGICETKKVSLTFLHHSGGSQFLRLHSEEYSNLWEGKLERWKFDPVYYKNNERNLVLDKLQFSRGLESRLSVLHQKCPPQLWASNSNLRDLVDLRMAFPFFFPL